MVVNMHAAKTHFSSLVCRALAGEEIIVAKSGDPVVRLAHGVKGRRERTPGLSAGLISYSSDFSNPLPEEVAEDFEK